MKKSKQTRVELYGSPGDPEVKSRMIRMQRAGHHVTIQSRPDYDTGIGICGKHLCDCEHCCDLK